MAELWQLPLVPMPSCLAAVGNYKSWSEAVSKAAASVAVLYARCSAAMQPWCCGAGEVQLAWLRRGGSKQPMGGIVNTVDSPSLHHSCTQPTPCVLRPRPVPIPTPPHPHIP